MIAYFILVHRYPNQFKRLFTAIYRTDNHYLIHVDKRSGKKLLAEIKKFLSTFPNAYILPSESVLWGGYSMVNAELRGIQELLKRSLDWQFFINLSGQDFPIKSQKYIHSYLKKHLGKDFIRVFDQRVTRPETLTRVENYVTEAEGSITSIPIQKRPFLKDVIPYIGHQWMILNRSFCEFLIHSTEVTRFKEFYQNTYIADEGFFQTVLMNTSYHSTLINDDKRTIDWIPMGTIKLRPRDFIAKDASFLLKSKGLFARKFDETVDEDILGILEKNISN